MFILFVVFVVIFLNLARCSFKYERKKAAKKTAALARLSSNDQDSKDECWLVRKLRVHCCMRTRRASRLNTAGSPTEEVTVIESKSIFDSCLIALGLKKNAERLPVNGASNEDSPMIVDEANIGGASPQQQSSKAGIRFSELDWLDKMRCVGEILERFIEERFQYLGRFCAEYPKLVLFLGLAFCSLMCLGYFNFEIEKDPIKLWSADSSIARKNKLYFDENFGPFYRITQLIIEPKPIVKSYNYTDADDNVYNITALKPEVLLEVYK